MIGAYLLPRGKNGSSERRLTLQALVSETQQAVFPMSRPPLNILFKL